MTLSEKLLDLLDDLIPVLDIGISDGLVIGRFQLFDERLQLVIFRHLLLQHALKLADP